MKVFLLLLLVASYPAIQAQMEVWSEEEMPTEEAAEGTLGGWTTLDLDEVNNNEEILGICNFGADKVIEIAVEDRKIPEANYKIAEILSVERQTVQGFNYRVHCKIENGEGTTVDTTFVVWVKPWRNEMQLTTWEYDFKIKDFTCWDEDVNDTDYSDAAEEWIDFAEDEEGSSEEEVLPEGFTIMSEEEIDGNEVIQKALDIGVAHVVEEGVKDGKIPDSKFEVAEIYRAWKEEINGMKYKFHCLLDNGKGTTVKTIFIVLSQEWRYYFLVMCSKYTVWKDLDVIHATDDTDEEEEDTTDEEAEVASGHNEVEWIGEEGSIETEAQSEPEPDSTSETNISYKKNG
jgi:hypothetical protein